MDAETVAKAFVDFYYPTSDAGRAGLANLYEDASMLTFEGQQVGYHNILEKLTSFPFDRQCKHLIRTVDFQSSGPCGGVFVFVTGNIEIVGEQHRLKFSQMFHLLQTTLQGNFIVLNDIFRLINA